MAQILEDINFFPGFRLLSSHIRDLGRRFIVVLLRFVTSFELYDLASHLTLPEQVDGHKHATRCAEAKLAVSHVIYVVKCLAYKLQQMYLSSSAGAYRDFQDLAAVRLFLVLRLVGCEQLTSRKPSRKGKSSPVAESQLVTITQQDRL
ncbi:MAG: hypothetical protein Q9174_004800 [Haloplaca sp. 1 TL-2023]